MTGRGDSWVLGLEQSAVFRRAVDAGINFIDTCDDYSVGNSEEIVGALIAEHGSRWTSTPARVAIRTSLSSRRRSARSGELRTGYIVQPAAADITRVRHLSNRSVSSAIVSPCIVLRPL